MEIGEKIRKLRTDAGLTQDELAAMACAVACVVAAAPAAAAVVSGSLG